MSETSWHVGVVIPARNEEALLERCLDSVFAAGALLPASTTWDIVVAIDASTDRTEEIARRMLATRGATVRSDAGCVGAARALAAQTALKRYAGALRSCWLANTDADCIVPPTWLADQLALARLEVEAVAGTVGIDTFAEHKPQVEELFHRTYLIGPDGTHPHVHGANLGVRADAYRRAGGWSSLATAEDHDLWRRLKDSGARQLATSALRVLTSGRRIGRAPSGFAQRLAAHNEAVL